MKIERDGIGEMSREELRYGIQSGGHTGRKRLGVLIVKKIEDEARVRCARGQKIQRRASGQGVGRIIGSVENDALIERDVIERVRRKVRGRIDRNHVPVKLDLRRVRNTDGNLTV